MYTYEDVAKKIEKEGIESTWRDMSNIISNETCRIPIQNMYNYMIKYLLKKKGREMRNEK